MHRLSFALFLLVAPSTVSAQLGTLQSASEFRDLSLTGELPLYVPPSPILDEPPELTESEAALRDELATRLREAREDVPPRQARRLRRLVDHEQTTASSPQSRAIASEALFLLAERQDQAFQAMVPPPFQGNVCDLEQVNDWAGGAYSRWADRAVSQLYRARDAYAAVSELGDARWTMLAAGRVGLLNLKLDRHLDTLPDPTLCHPNDWQHGSYRPARWIARSSLEFCVDVAVEYRLFGKDSTRCFDALSELSPQSHPVANELVPVRPRGNPMVIVPVERYAR